MSYIQSIPTNRYENDAFPKTPITGIIIGDLRKNINRYGLLELLL